MRYTVTVHHYHFNPPSQITETEYKYYKELIRSDPKAKLNDKLPENPIKKGLGIALKVGLFPLAAISPGFLEGEIKSAINKARAKKDENEFYSELKRMVIESDSFYDFSNKVKARFTYYK